LYAYEKGKNKNNKIVSVLTIEMMQLPVQIFCGTVAFIDLGQFSDICGP
jgi:hypothetical protein